MKTIKTRFFLCVFVALFGFLSFDTFGQVDHYVKIGFDSTILVPGSPISVPIKMTGTAIGNFRHIVMYDHDVLTYTSTTVPSTSKIYPSILNPNPNHASYPGGIYISYTTASPYGFDYLNDEVVYYLNFTYNGGATNFTWYPESPTPPGVLGSWLRNSTNAIPPYWTGKVSWTAKGAGAASGDYLTLHSVSSGGDWGTASTWQENKTPSRIYDVFITNGVVTDNSATGRCHNLNIEETGKLTVVAGKSLTVTGDFLIKSDASSTGSFVDLGTTTIAGSTTVNRYMDGNWVAGNTSYKSHLVSSPVAAQSNDIFTGSLMNKWNEEAYNWDPMTLPFDYMAVGKGYAVSPADPGLTATFTGPLNTGDITITGLTKTPKVGIDPKNIGFNLVGNPFASSINWNSNITRVKVKKFAWIWNGAGAYIPLSQDISGSIIASGQGFFVQDTIGGGSITIPKSVRTHDGTFYKSDNSNLLTLKVEGNSYWDQTQVYITDMSSNGYDNEYDALKLMGSPVAPQLYCMIPDTKLSINSLPSLDESSKIELGFRPGTEGNFIITAQDLETFTASNELYLIDLLTNTTQNLKSNPVYTFNAAPGQLEHRFNLTFSTVGIGEVGASKLNIYAVEKVVNVEIPTGVKGDIVVYNLLGSEIARKAVEANSLNKINLNVPSGYYLVKVNGVSYTANGKVFIK